jgi:hypothetical protein
LEVDLVAVVVVVVAMVVVVEADLDEVVVAMGEWAAVVVEWVVEEIGHQDHMELQANMGPAKKQKGSTSLLHTVLFGSGSNFLHIIIVMVGNGRYHWLQADS